MNRLTNNDLNVILGFFISCPAKSNSINVVGNTLRYGDLVIAKRISRNYIVATPSPYLSMLRETSRRLRYKLDLVEL